MPRNVCGLYITVVKSRGRVRIAFAEETDFESDAVTGNNEHYTGRITV